MMTPLMRLSLMLGLAMLGSGACARDRVCEQGSCESSSADTAPLADASVTAETTAPIDGGSLAADAAGGNSTDASSAPGPAIKPVACEGNGECPPATPVCSPVLGLCVVCLENDDCSAPTSVCATQSGPTNNRCVECLHDSDCTAGVCVANSCLACDILTHEGCDGETPFCAEPDTEDAEQSEPSCAACLDDEHCREAPHLTCADGSCAVCDLDTDRGCDGVLSTCFEGPSVATDGGQEGALDRRCVECASVADCSPEAPYCVNDRCSECALEDNAGCDTDRPWCLPGSHFELPAEEADAEASRCYECRDDTDCQSEGLARCVAGTCEACASDLDCTDREAAYCDPERNECVPCSASEHCAHLPETPVCVTTAQSGDGADGSGRCVQCSAAESGACGQNSVCRTVPGEGQFECVGRQPGAVVLCGACVSDADCSDSAACVELSYQSAGPLGWYCLQREGRAPELSECGRPFSVTVEAQSADGVSGTYCAPITTCRAYTDYLDTPCEEDADCGVAGVEDGVCRARTADTQACTYKCRGHLDCKELVTCTDAPDAVCSF